MLLTQGGERFTLSFLCAMIFCWLRRGSDLPVTAPPLKPLQSYSWDIAPIYQLNTLFYLPSWGFSQIICRCASYCDTQRRECWWMDHWQNWRRHFLMLLWIYFHQPDTRGESWTLLHKPCQNVPACSSHGRDRHRHATNATANTSYDHIYTETLRHT